MSSIPVDITFRHTDPTDWVKDLVKEQVEKLRGHSSILHRVESVIDKPQQHSRKGDNYEVHLVLHVDKMKEMAITRAASGVEAEHLHAAVLDAFGAAERMLRRRVERRRDLHRTPSNDKTET